MLCIADEVMCGMGRTGSFFALEQEGIHADITTMAKGLGAGYQLIAAVMVSETVVKAIDSGSGHLWNGHTYMSLAAAGALAVQKEIENESLLENVHNRGAQLQDALNTRFGQHPNVGNIRGRGLFWSVEMATDKTAKRPFPATDRLAANIQKAALDLGLLSYPSQSCADGINGDHVLLVPSYTSTVAEIDQVVGIIAKAVNSGLKEGGA